VLWIVAMLVTAAPLWLVRDLPMVDLPQHLYLLDVLHRLRDATTLYPATFEFRFRFTPYLGYYAAVGGLNALLPLEVANKLFVSAAVVGLPLATAFLLRSLGRPTWPALLAVSVAYGDNFGWGFVNTSAAIPLALVSLGAFVRAIADPVRRARWTVVFGTSLLAGFLMHPVPTLFLVPALPLALGLTRAGDDDRGGSALDWWRRRLVPLAGVTPFLLAALLWMAGFVSTSPELRPGGAHASWGRILTSGSIGWQSPGTNLRALLWLGANLFDDGSDSLALLLALILGLAALVARFFESAPVATTAPLERMRPWAFVVVALGLFTFLPLDVPGVVQYLNPRLAPLVLALAATLVPRGGARSTRWLTLAAAATPLVLAIPLAIGLRRFDAEASALRRVAAGAAERPRIMGLVFEPHSHFVHHPVYLHGAALIARLKGGLPNYSLAGWQQVSLRYRGAPPPALPSEWRPDLFDYGTMGGAYDHFLVRGAPPDSLFGARLGTELRVAAHDGDWWLLRRAAADSGGPRAP